MASKLSLGIVGAVGMAIALSTVGNSAAFAQAEPVTVAQYRNEELDNADLEPIPTIPQAFNRAYYSRRGNYFDNRQIWQSFSLILEFRAFQSSQSREMVGALTGFTARCWSSRYQMPQFCGRRICPIPTRVRS